VERTGRRADPVRVLEDAHAFQFRGSRSWQSKTPMLFCRVLFVIVNHLACGPKPHS
jgi:hypothetical protein